jgi:hypothetical protein
LFPGFTFYPFNGLTIMFTPKTGPMETIDSIPQMLNEIFSEFMEAAKVEVCYRSDGPANGEPGVQRYRIASLNGHESLPCFRLALYDMQETLLFRVRSSLPLLAAFFRMLYDLQLFDMENKSKFCRVIVALFDTHSKKDLSAGNFKNHFDAPAPEVIGQLIALLVRMLHYLRNFKFNL